MVSVLQDERDRQLAHSGPHIEVHPEGSLRTSTRVWSWVVIWSLPVLASSLGSIRLPRRYIFGRRITALREAGLYGCPVNRACEDLRGLTSGWSGPASAGRSPAIHSASA